MKIRTDYVTNSSSSSFITVKVKSKRMQELLELESSSELNEMMENALGWAEEEFEGYGIPFIDSEDEDQDVIGSFDSVSGYLLFLLQGAGEIDEEFDADEMTDGDLQAVEIDHAEFDDGGYGPFEYVRINNKKKLTIRIEETYDDDAYKDEDISGMEFYIIGAMEEFSNLEAIKNYIKTHGGSIAEAITDRTRYAVCADFKKNAAELKKIRTSCIPVLSEAAFNYRYLDDTPYDDIYHMAYEVGFDLTFLNWFEKYGLGETSIAYWKNNEWVSI